MKKMLLALVLVAAFAATSFAYTVNIATDDSQKYTTSALTGYTTYGNMMAGMQVTAYLKSTFSGTTFQETATWVAGSGTVGYVSDDIDAAILGGTWSLTQTGDTWDTQWVLNSTNSFWQFTGFSINGIPGNTVFDRTNPNPGTSGSASGKDFAPIGSDAGTIDVLYSGALLLGDADPVGDLWLFLDVQFKNFTTKNFKFYQDTDSIKYAGDITPVPEPATFLLLGAGLMGLMGCRRFKK